MLPHSPAPRSLRLLFAIRVVRLFSYGFIAVILVLHLAESGLNEVQIGLFLTTALLGGAGLSLLISVRADRLGRRRMLLLGSVLMIAGGAMLAGGSSLGVLLAAAAIGVISPTGNETGPFLAIEQAAMSQITADGSRTGVFALSHVIGFSANALGSLAGGWLAQGLQAEGMDAAASYRAAMWVFPACGAVIFALSLALERPIETNVAADTRPRLLGLGESRGIVFKLSALFAVDAFGGGFIVQSFIAWWFHLRFGTDTGMIGSVLFGANLLSGLSALAAVPLARRFGLINTMVFTHLPSNFMLMAIPFMPTFGLAAAVLLARHLISQMDVPTRQSYVNAVVEPGERSAANGVTATARQIGTAAAPLIAAPMMAAPALAALPFVLSGAIKAAYDVALWVQFRRVKPPEERRVKGS